MDDEQNAAPETSPFVDYLIQQRRAHGAKSRELFKAEDVRDSLARKSTESMVLKSKDRKGQETAKGKAKVRYLANNVFAVYEVRAFHGRFSGDALYTPGRGQVWHRDVFPPPQWPRPSLLGSLLESLNKRLHRALTDAEKSELQAMVEKVMADYLALDKTQQLIAPIDKAEALVDEEWAKEQALYTANFESGGEDRPHE